MKIEYLTRNTLLYKSAVEYGSWTINHIHGCTHGCTFPCYAFMMAKRFGRVKDYNDWRCIKIVSNALELLDKEIKKYKSEIDFVHMSFMTDPFMYDYQKKEIILEVLESTLSIIKKLNENGIKVTTLTKGLYPDTVLSDEFSKENEYGITLVSLDKNFHQKFEPYSSEYEDRVKSLKKLHDNGLKTWVSIEPYPTPLLDPKQDISKLLKKISFVNKIIFGRLNYNAENSKYPNIKEYYEETAKKVIEFCNKNNIEFHIKEGTQQNYNEETENIFK